MSDDLNGVVEVKAKVSVGQVNVPATPAVGYMVNLPSVSGQDGKVLGVNGGNLEWTEYESVKQDFSDRLDALEAASENYVDNGELEDGMLYLTHNGDRVAGPLGPFAGGGGGTGGGGGNAAVYNIKNTTGWLSKTISRGEPCTLSFTWSSIEDGLSTGDGSATIQVNGITKATQNVAQGDVTLEIGSYLDSGTNKVKVKISDAYGNGRTINFTINSLQLTIESSFDPSIPYTGAIAFSYTPTGAVLKSIHFVVDGSDVGTVETSVSAKQMTYTIPQQKHGGHTLECYFTCKVNGETVTSNRLHYEIICLESGNTTPIIVSSFNTTSVTQYTTVNIPYIVYYPGGLTAAVTITVNGDKKADITVDRTQQTFTYRADTVGDLTIVIKSGSASKMINLTVTESNVHVSAETDQLVLYLSSQGRSNNEAKPGTWKYNNVSARMTGFNFASDGWVNDDDGITALRVAGDARVDIPDKIFAEDCRTTGKTIEIEFATNSVMNYDATIISCYSGGRGFQVTPQKIFFKSEQSEISTQFKENEHNRITFVVEKRSKNRLIYCYINGIMSGTVQYPVDDDFSQKLPVDITIGSNDATVDLYCIRVYDTDLTKEQVLTNWIADTQLGDVLIERYNRNNLYDEYGKIVISKLPSNLPYMIITNSELPQYKGDKKTVSIEYTDPLHPSRSFTAEGVQLDVQGTSSQYYRRKNYKAKMKKGLTLANGKTAAKYELRPGAIPESTFCFKADVASSEGANNVELVRAYNDACPYKTPAQQENPKCRQGIDGFPMVIFWNDGTNTTFLGKYNFNNDKSDEDTIGFKEDDVSFETLNNTSDRVRYKSADYSGTDWLNDFEARYPDTDPPYEDPTQLKAFADFVVSTDTTVAGLTEDEKKARLQKFKDGIGNYVELDDTIFYYIFTELFLMVDSRAKNSFPSFMGSTVTV